MTKYAQFKIECDSSIFLSDELEKLLKYGTWLNYLMHEYITPNTEAQKDFIRCCKGEKDSETFYEKLWFKYRVQLLYEQAIIAAKQCGQNSYALVHWEFEQLAMLGHTGAKDWLNKEASSVVSRGDRFESDDIDEEEDNECVGYIDHGESLTSLWVYNGLSHSTSDTFNQISRDKRRKPGSVI
jgi:uncharacterized protein YifE (UPF0438 family)